MPSQPRLSLSILGAERLYYATQQYIIHSTIPIWIVAATTPNASAQSNPVFLPSVMTAFPPRHLMIRAGCAAIGALSLAACAATTDPVRRYGVLDDLGQSDWQSVSVGGDHSCGLKTNGNAYCWGSNQYGQLGVARSDTVCGTARAQYVCNLSPTPVQPGLKFASVSAGARHSCGITTARDAYCWGVNDAGQVSEAGNGGPSLAKVSGTLGWTQISAGYSHTCAVRTDGALFCWGANDRGQLGNGTIANSTANSRVRITAPVASVSAGQQRTCARTTVGAVYCWGAVWTERQSGLELTRAQMLPELVPQAPALASVSVGSFTTCGSDLAGVGYCWEANPRGGMGTGDQTGSTTPKVLASDLGFIQVSAGIVQSCGVATSGAGYCWGDDTFGQLGVPPTTLTGQCGDQQLACATAPVPVFGRQKFREISTGFGSHSCGVTTQGNLYCWGLGLSGQRGDGSENYAISTPIMVAEPKPTP
ncbi:MAG: protein kinase [Gemmatimonadetes bacterium]|nr:protein kinase [Gemmatimonadota bacterium]